MLHVLRKSKITICLIILILCVFVLCFKYKSNNILNVSNENNLLYDNVKKIDLLFTLEIPKINLKKGIYKINSNNNSVDKNITILNNSVMPNSKKGNIYLAAHNGNTKISFFNKIDKLDLNDLVLIHYKGVKYRYIVDEKYEIDKKGTHNFFLTDSNVLYLITCIKNTNKQLVVKCIKNH